MLNNKFGPFKIERFASKTDNLLSINYTKDDDAYSTNWVRTSFYGNPKYTNDDIYRALDKAISEFQTQPETTKFMFILPMWETANWYKTFIHYFEIVEELPKGEPNVFTLPHGSISLKVKQNFHLTTECTLVH
jgi:hypothetical protein